MKKTQWFIFFDKKPTWKILSLLNKLFEYTVKSTEITIDPWVDRIVRHINLINQQQKNILCHYNKIEMLFFFLLKSLFFNNKWLRINIWRPINIIIKGTIIYSIYDI